MENSQIWNHKIVMTSMVLVVIGALILGIIGLNANYSACIGSSTFSVGLKRLIYIIIGLAAIYLIAYYGLGKQKSMIM